jgi:phosphatidate cytidylyltransferase
LLLIALGVLAFREFRDLSSRFFSRPVPPLALVGSLAIAGFGVIALLQTGENSLFLVSALAVAASLVMLLPRSSQAGVFTQWTAACTGVFYLGLPVYAAIALRALPGDSDAPWLAELATRVSLGWAPSPRGLAWVLVVVLSTWVGDSAAYLAGRSLGRRRLAPNLSPNKTWEGAAGGLAASAVTGSVVFSWCGLGPWWLGLAVGGAIGVAGQIGDLGESLLKRQAGVKDSGAAIPGHGGILDRIDALLFAFPVGYLLAVNLDRMTPQ